MDQPAMESMTATEAAAKMEALLGEPEETEQVEAEAETEQEEPDVEQDTEEASDDDSEEAEPDEESEQPELESLADLAEALEVPLEELQANLKTKIKVNGEELTVTLAELTQGYQKDADYRQKTSELATQRKAFTEAYQQANERLNQEFTQLGQLMHNLEQHVVQPPDPNEMAYLKQTDPNQYLIRKSEYDEKLSQFAQLRNMASQAYHQSAYQIQAHQEQMRSELLQKAMAELPLRVPDWSPDKKTKLDTYLTSDKYGYTPEELAQITDVRLIELVNKAMLYDQGQQKVEVTKAKVKTLPKFQKPSASKGIQPKPSVLQKTKAQFAKKGSINIDDASSAIANLL